MSSQSHSATLQSSLLAASLAFAAPALAGDVTVTLDAASGFVIEDNTGTIERLRVAEATGNLSRNGALFVHTTGTGTFVGAGAGSLANTGNYNSGFGANALTANTTGSSNTAVGNWVSWIPHHLGGGRSRNSGRTGDLSCSGPSR